MKLNVDLNPNKPVLLSASAALQRRVARAQFVLAVRFVGDRGVVDEVVREIVAVRHSRDGIAVPVPLGLPVGLLFVLLPRTPGLSFSDILSFMDMLEFYQMDPKNPTFH